MGAGITAIWSGPLNGIYPLIKNGTGTLVLGNLANTFTGMTSVNAGTLRVQGVLPSAYYRSQSVHRPMAGSNMLTCQPQGTT